MNVRAGSDCEPFVRELIALVHLEARRFLDNDTGTVLLPDVGMPLALAFAVLVLVLRTRGVGVGVLLLRTRGSK